MELGIFGGIQLGMNAPMDVRNHLWGLIHFYTQQDSSNGRRFNISNYITLNHPYLPSISLFFPTPTFSPII
jgi:hypothetical protein